MKAIVQSRYGSSDVLELREIDKPVVKDDEVLVRVHATSVHPDVWHVMRGLPYILRIMGSGLTRPKNRVPGTDMAGTVEVVGEDAGQFQQDDEVFGETTRRHQWQNGGAFAEYVAVPEEALALKPANLGFEEAAAVPTSGLIALENLRDRIKPGQKILINGAGGGVGVFAVQIAKAFGADVTGVDKTAKLDMVRAIGADHVIDYTQEDFTRNGERYDLIFDIPGNRSIADLRRSVTTDGTYVLIGHDLFGGAGGRWIGGSLGRFLKLVTLAPFGRRPKRPRSSKESQRPLVVLRELVEAGKITPVVDKTYPLSQVGDAIRYLEEGQAQGKIVITL